jgi:hypothetical protein
MEHGTIALMAASSSNGIAMGATISNFTSTGGIIEQAPNRANPLALKKQRR